MPQPVIPLLTGQWNGTPRLRCPRGVKTRTATRDHAVHRAKRGKSAYSGAVHNSARRLSPPQHRLPSGAPSKDPFPETGEGVRGRGKLGPYSSRTASADEGGRTKTLIHSAAMARKLPSQAALKRRAAGLDPVPDPLKSAQARSAADVKHARGKVDLDARQERAIEGTRTSAEVAQRVELLAKRDAEKLVKSIDYHWLRKFHKRQTVSVLGALSLAADNAKLAVQTVVRLMSDDKQPGSVRLVAARTVMEWAQWENAAQLMSKPEHDLTAEEIEAQIEADLATMTELEGAIVIAESEVESAELTESPKA